MGAAVLPSVMEGKTRGHDAESPSARAQAIARSHEEMLGLLRDLPETEYELSFTDLVERRQPAAADGESVVAVEKASADEGPAAHGVDKAKERWVRRSSSERRTSGGGVLLNVYVPSSLTRSLTESRLRRGPSSRGEADSNKRGRRHLGCCCWSAIWERGRKEKTRRH